MADIPPDMLMGERQPDPIFADTEVLLRRFRPDHFDGSEIALEAFELPDMSVNREKFGPARWLLLDEELHDWGVGAFHVEDIPRDEKLLHLGIIVYILQAEHVPHRNNYPHSEVRIYRDGARICRQNQNLELLEPEFHIRWRERLSRSSWIAIRPTELE